MWNSGLLSISIYSPVWETFPVSDSGLHGWKPKPTGQTTQSWPGTWLGFDRRPAPYPCRIKALGSSDLTWKHLQLPASHTSSSTKHFLRGAWRAGRRSDFSENKDERLRARTGKRNPGECWDPNHSPLLSFIRLFFLSGATRAASAGAFPPALCWSSPAWLCPSPGSTSIPTAGSAAGGSGTVMSKDLPIRCCCVSWHKPRRVSVKCREESFQIAWCLKDTSPHSKVKSMAKQPWCNQLEKDAEGIKPQCLALTGRGGAGLDKCLLRCGKCKIDFLLHLTRFSLSPPLLHPFMIKFKNNSDFEMQIYLKV